MERKRMCKMKRNWVTLLISLKCEVEGEGHLSRNRFLRATPLPVPSRKHPLLPLFFERPDIYKCLDIALSIKSLQKDQQTEIGFTSA
ncbi:hypothetical protein CDAR_283571 [Caerostris darwini]|uniref:Uncharacterized protein n=1 Tax=Caerostris darwini TaxID=1538125 RepID=A0AAV4PAE4_9ARAC|nr:hypothetical protein CDAR_283571 [Caerostris darwini]